MSQLPTPKELLDSQVERVLRLYDRGLLGLDELDAIRSELLDDTAQDAVASLLDSTESVRVRAFLRGEVIPDDEPDSPVEAALPSSTEEPVEPTESLEDGFFGESLEEETEGTEAESEPIRWAPTVLLILTIGSVFWFLANKGEAPHGTVHENPPASGPLKREKAPALSTASEETEATPAEAIFGTRSAGWKGHGMEGVVESTGDVLSTQDLSTWMGNTLETVAGESEWESGGDLTPWTRTLSFTMFAGETPIPVTLSKLRSGFPELGKEGGYAIEWTLPSSMFQGDSFRNQMPKAPNDEGLQGTSPTWCYGEVGAGGVCWTLSPKRGDGGVLTLVDRGVYERMLALEVALARPLGRYTEARNALFGPDANLTEALDAGREALALFGAVHPRLFHGDTMVNLCRAYLLRGDRSEARIKCQMVVDQSLDREARGEALYLLTRLSLWQNEKEEAKTLISRAAGLVRGPTLKREVLLYKAILDGEEWTSAQLRHFGDLVGCEKGRALGESWRWLPMELGFRDQAELLTYAEDNGLSRFRSQIEKASETCRRGERL